MINMHETEKEKLQNLQKMLKDATENAEIKSIILNAVKNRKDMQKTIEYLREKYNVDDKYINLYMQSLSENAEKRLNELKNLDEINNKLFYNISKNAKNANISTLKILLPFLLLKDVAEQFNLSAQMFANNVKKLLLNYANKKDFNEYTQKYLNEINKIVGNIKEEDEAIDAEIIENAAANEVKKLEQKDAKQLLENWDNTQEAEIKQIQNLAAEQTQNVFLLEHKESEKTLKNNDKETFKNFENFCAYKIAALQNNEINDFTAKFEMVHDAAISGLGTSLAFSLIKQLFNNFTKNEYAKLATLAYASQQNKLPEHLFTLKNGDSISKLNESDFNAEFKKLLKTDADIAEFYNDIKDEVYNVNVNDLKFKEHVNKKKAQQIGFF